MGVGEGVGEGDGVGDEVGVGVGVPGGLLARAPLPQPGIKMAESRNNREERRTAGNRFMGVPMAGEPEYFLQTCLVSHNSSVFHVSLACKAAKAIKPANRITGPAAKEGRTQHVGCPIQ